MNQLCKSSQGVCAAREQIPEHQPSRGGADLAQPCSPGDTAGNAQHRTAESLLKVGSLHRNGPLLMLRAERSLEATPKKNLAPLAIGMQLKSFLERRGICEMMFELWAPPHVAFLHIAWLTKPVPDAKEDQKPLDVLPQASAGQRYGSPRSPRE